MILNKQFWYKRKVLLTGHTGFKGAWAALLLESMGADVFGLSLPPTGTPSLYEILSPWSNLNSIYCDIRDKIQLQKHIEEVKPEIVIHMAAQALVLESYNSPVDTIETNIMGTVHLLEALRTVSDLKAILVITSDKVYENNNDSISMLESSPLGGHDPYSASKAATEVVTGSYAKCFFDALGIPLCTARAGNVIGGGDWAKNRILPDLWRAYIHKQPVSLRYPGAVRPWQHVLDPVYGYLLYIQHMVAEPMKGPRALNFGPSITKRRTVLELAKQFSTALKTNNLFEVGKVDAKLSECEFLSIDASLAKKTIQWESLLDVDKTIQLTGLWYRAFQNNEDMRLFSLQQINDFLSLTLKIDCTSNNQISKVVALRD